MTNRDVPNWTSHPYAPTRTLQPIPRRNSRDYSRDRVSSFTIGNRPVSRGTMSLHREMPAHVVQGGEQRGESHTEEESLHMTY